MLRLADAKLQAYLNVNPEQRVKIGELSARSGVAPSAIRFYESSGLLPPAERGANGYRVYDDSTLQCLLAIQLAQRLGFSLETLRKLAAHSAAELPHELVMQSLRERLAEIVTMQQQLARQHEETQALMRQLEAEWREGRCLSLEPATAVHRKRPRQAAHSA